VLSGADGSVLVSAFGNLAGDRFGTSVSDAGDVDGDGTPDWMAGSPTDNGGRGSMYV
jgi:hypothetical protein